MATTQAPQASQAPQQIGEQTLVEALLEARERMELTADGWVEKVRHPAHGRGDARLTVRLVQLGMSEADLYLNVRLTPEPNGRRYVPDLVVILPSNPVAPEGHADYAGAPDLVIETLSPESERRDWGEKRDAYAPRGVPPCRAWRRGRPSSRSPTWRARCSRPSTRPPVASA